MNFGIFRRVRSNYDPKSNLNGDGVDANVPFSTVYGLKQNFKLINLSNQSLNIIPNTEKTMKIGSDDLAVDRNALELLVANSADVAQTTCDTNNIRRISSTESPTGLRKRNVNWNVPIQSRSLTKEMVGESYGQPSVNCRNFNEVKAEPPNAEPDETRRLSRDRVDEVGGREPAIDDDGFESLNGKSSSGEDNAVTSVLLTTDLIGESTRNISVNDLKQSLDVSAAEHSMVRRN